ncbi:MAG: GAF domain-containing protein [Elusimicrobia bacterium]|nr:GAF domain-containing protein [Elusimicrobiota bacterium]
MLETPLLNNLYEALKNLYEKKFVQEEEIWTLTLDKIGQALGTDSGAFLTWEPKEKQLIPLCRMGASKENHTHPDAFKGIHEWTVQYKKTAVVNDTSKDPRVETNSADPKEAAPKSVLTVPVFRHEDLLGVLEICNSKQGFFTAENQEFIEFLAAHTGLVVQSLRMQQALSRVTAHNASILENLTGGFIGIDIRGNVMIINPRARQILEIAEEDVVGKPIEWVLQNCPGLSLVLKECLARNHTVKRQEIPWMHKGQKKTLGYSTLLIQDVQGGVAGAGVTFQDLTQFTTER